MKTLAGTRALAPRARFGYLHVHRFLFRLGLSIANIFAWIFVFQYFYIQSGRLQGSLISTILMYCLAQATTIILTPLSAAHLRHCVKHSIVYGALAAGAAYIYLGATLFSFSGGLAEWGIAIFALLLGAYRALYWVPYQLEASGASKERSRMPIAYEAVIALMPIFAGVTLATVPFAPQRILFGAVIFILLSLLPLLPLRNMFEGFSWSYGETFRQYFSPRHRQLLITSLMQGLQGATLFLLWPIAVFFIVGSQFHVLGAVISATLFAVLLLRALYSRFIKRTGLDRSIIVLSVFSASGWLMRLFAGTPFVIFFVDAYSHVSSSRISNSIDIFAYEQTADQGSFIDEYTTLKEIGLAFGRILACLVCALLLIWTSFAIAFASIIILTAVVSAVFVIIERTAAPTVY